MSAPKVVIIVLILFAVIFAVGVGAGMRSGGSAVALDDFPPSWLDGLGSAFSPKVEFSAITGGCIDREARAFAVPSGSTCQVTLPAHQDDTQNLKMMLAAGSRVIGQYTAPASQDSLASQEVELPVGKRTEVTVAVLPEGGVLSLTCPSDATKTDCRIELP